MSQIILTNLAGFLKGSVRSDMGGYIGTCFFGEKPRLKLSRKNDHGGIAAKEALQNMERAIDMPRLIQKACFKVLL